MTIQSSIETPAQAARDRLKSALKPGQTLYLIMRRISRSRTSIEISVLVMGGLSTIRDISRDVAATLGYVYGVNGGVIFTITDSGEDDAGLYVSRWLSELCGFADRPLRYQWL
mgnify:CR=1 FL=1